MKQELVNETANYQEDTYFLNYFNHFIQFLRENTIQLILFFIVFIIIYYVDKISRYNLSVYGLPSAIPINNNINNKNNKINTNNKINKLSNKNKKIKFQKNK